MIVPCPSLLRLVELGGDFCLVLFSHLFLFVLRYSFFFLLRIGNLFQRKLVLDSFGSLVILLENNRKLIQLFVEVCRILLVCLGLLKAEFVFEKFSLDKILRLVFLLVLVVS